MDGVQGPELDRQEPGSDLEDTVTDSEQVESGEDLDASTGGVRAEGRNRATDLGPSQRARDEGCASTEVPPQGSRLRLGDHKLDDR